MNKLLLITRNTIPYVREIRPLAGSVTASILLQQLEYWTFKMRERGQPFFYKFLSPCDNKLYKIGHSWTEELAFSKDEFRAAFDKIGIRYNSKTAFRKANENGVAFIKTEKDGNTSECLYLSFMDKTKHLTYYVRNDQLLDRKLDEIIGAKQNSQSREIGIPNLREIDYSNLQEISNSNLGRSTIPISGDRDSQSRYVTETTQRLLRKEKERKKETENPKTKKTNKNSLSLKNQDLFNRVFKIWENETGIALKQTKSFIQKWNSIVQEIADDKIILNAVANFLNDTWRKDKPKARTISVLFKSVENIEEWGTPHPKPNLKTKQTVNKKMEINSDIDKSILIYENIVKNLKLTPNQKGIWEKARETLKANIKQPYFDKFIGNLMPVEFSENKITVISKGEQIAKHVNTRYKKEMKDAFGKRVKINVIPANKHEMKGIK